MEWLLSHLYLVLIVVSAVLALVAVIFWGHHPKPAPAPTAKDTARPLPPVPPIPPGAVRIGPGVSSEQVNEAIKAAVRRQSGPLLALILSLAGFVLLTACQASYLDAARKDLTTTLSVQITVTQRFAAWNLQHQMDLVHKSTDRAAAAAALKAYREKRAPLMTLAADTQRTLDDCAEVLLLAATPADADAAAGKARAAVTLFRDKFTALQGGQ